MQRVSAAYKAEQKEYLRQEGYVWVYLGIISKEAQANAIPEGTFTVYSEEEKTTQSPEFEAYYATPEENFTRVDSTQFFMPRNGGFALYQGAVTQEICAPITYRFGKYTSLNIKGLTIDFGDNYPTSFTITNGDPQYTYDYTNDAPGEWVCEDVFRGSPYITITPHSMKGGRQRMRILSILFGVGLVFANDSLLSTKWKSSCQHIMDSLPSKSFEFSVSNLNRKFAADDPHSFAAFLQQDQNIEFHYGRRLLDGTMYTIPGGKLRLKTWSSDDTQAKFSAVGFLDYMSGTYYKGQYYSNGISLYDLAVDVCTDAGIENYCIDNYLQTLITHNPLPVEKHRNLLQLIANASRSIMRETRDGGLEIQSSFVPELISITTNSEASYSRLENVLKDEITCIDYASSEKDFTTVDNTQYFAPREEESLPEACYVSAEAAREDGTFATNPKIIVQWEAAWTFFDMSVIFGAAIPEEFVLNLYNYGTLQETIVVDEVDKSTILNYEFYNIDKLEIEFTKAKPYQRIHIFNIVFGKITDYTLDYSDMSKSPKASTTEFVKDVNVVYSEFAYGSEAKKLSTTKAAEGENTVLFNKPCHSYSLAYKDGGSGTLTITASGAYYVTFTSSRATEVDISGIEFIVSEKTHTIEVNQVGTDKTASNVLIDNITMAEDEADWLAEYFSNDVEYEINYRGEPALDPDDQIYTENKYVELNLVRIVESQIDTSTGMSMSCKLKGRRTSYAEMALVDEARVDISMVYGDEDTEINTISVNGVYQRITDYDVDIDAANNLIPEDQWSRLQASLQV